MGKKKELNARQRKFCLLRTSGMTQIDAYKKAGYKGKRCDASVLEDNPNVIKQNQLLQERAEKKSLDLAVSCQELSPRAIKRLTELLLQKKAPQVAIRAIQEIFDRGFGKPRETIDTGVTIVWDIGVKNEK